MNLAVGWANRQTTESVYRKELCRCEPNEVRRGNLLPTRFSHFQAA
ncbi:MAG: hypothetical protein IKZ88_05760 [Neisseriaceae bacterium]|nr:hypothetical protein [Neisseriaceae bacterium]